MEIVIKDTSKIQKFLKTRYGSGYGYSSGDGSGSGYGDDISVFNHQIVYYIDRVATLIKAVFGNYAKGYILQKDLTLKSCYIAKGESFFAHGETLAEAVRALNDKLFENMDEDERIAAFWECHENGVKYPAMDLYEWHHKLTGSCEMGRRNFAAERGIDLDKDEFTVDEFINLCRNSYGGEVILKLKEAKNEMEAKEE